MYKILAIILLIFAVTINLLPDDTDDRQFGQVIMALLMSMSIIYSAYCWI